MWIGCIWRRLSLGQPVLHPFVEIFLLAVPICSQRFGHNLASADLVVSKCLLKSTDQLCRTIFRVFATLVCGRPRLLCPALEKRPKALVGATDVAVATFL